MKGFEIGIHDGQIASFTATPEYFDIGDDIAIDMAFNNTGTVNIAGTAVIRVQDEAGELVQEFRHDVTDLAPANSISFNDTWDTSGAEEGCYKIIGFVLYASKATDPASATVSTSPEDLPHPAVVPEDLPHPAVGVEIYSVNKVSLVAPWITLALVIVASGIYLVRRRVHNYK
jgi:hypothetical protein